VGQTPPDAAAQTVGSVARGTDDPGDPYKHCTRAAGERASWIGSFRPRSARRSASWSVAEWFVFPLLMHRIVSVFLIAAALAVGSRPVTAQAVEVVVEGVRGAERDNVLALLTLEQRRADAALTESQVRRLHGRAASEIRAALEPFGYYRADVDAELERTATGWRVTYRIDPGEPVRLAEVDVRLLGPGADDAAFRDRVASFPLRPGDPLRHAQYEEGKLELLTVAAERGYLQARLAAHRIAVDTAAGQAWLTLHLETGERHRFGEVRFHQTGFSDDLLRASVPFRAGEPYSTARLLELQRTLIETDFFRSVDVRARPELADGLAVPVDVTLEARPRGQYSAGVGYGTDTGPRGTGAWEVRRINRWGHRMNGEARLSPTRSGVSTRFSIPFGPAGGQFTLSAGLQDERPRTHTTQTLVLGAGLNHRRGHWRETLYLNLQQDWFEVGGARGGTRTVLPGASWTRTRADDPIHATRGSRVSLDVRGTDEVLGSEVGFAQATLRGRWVRSPHRESRLLLRADLGYTAVDDFASLPPTMRYFAGGDQSVRGYGFQRLGPSDAGGQPLGGRHLAVASVEFERMLRGDWGAAVFYDIGNALNRVEDRLNHGAGAGLRWRSPVGMVRLDVASAVSEPGRPLRLHVVVGPEL
jgi:translocation and assembly module TamA